MLEGAIVRIKNRVSRAVSFEMRKEGVHEEDAQRRVSDIALVKICWMTNATSP